VRRIPDGASCLTDAPMAELKARVIKGPHPAVHKLVR